MEGKTGTVEGKRGQAYIVKAKDLKAMKTFIIKPIHLKKLK
jgi:large subunit ribosomal protein L21e